MSIIDKQRIAAVATLEALGYAFTLAAGWSPPTATPPTGTVATARVIQFTA